MQKTLIGLSLTALLASAQVFADQATLDALKGQGIALTAEQSTAIAAAEGAALAAEIAGLVALNQPVSPTIVRAAACAAPQDAPAIIEQSIGAAQQQAEAINAAVALGCEGLAGLDVGTGAAAPGSGVPTGGGSGGSASPN